MAMATEGRRGVIGGSAAVLRELLQTPKVRRSIEIILGDLDPENAPALVDAAMEDPSLPFDVLASMPAMANAGAHAAEALLGKIVLAPPKLLRSFAVRLLDGVDAERFGTVTGLALVLGLRSQRDESLRAALHSFSERYRSGVGSTLESYGEKENVAQGVQALADALRRVAREDPAFIEDVVSPIVDAARDSLAAQATQKGARDEG